MEAKNEKVKVKPVEKEVLAEAIVAISGSLQSLLSSGLTQEAIIVLVHDDSKVGKPTIRAVLSSLRGLKQRYCKP
jgi:hypothetical protein